MLLQPRAYKELLVVDRGRDGRRWNKVTGYSFFEQTIRPHEERLAIAQARKMLLVHQAGAVKVGEIVRYTLTYTPSNDRILPTPTHLHLKIKNTCAIPLRAAWLHGPYVLHVATYPATFNPHHKVEEPEKYGVPEYEPMLKAGGSWQVKLRVPDEIRETGADLGKKRHSAEQHQWGEQEEPKSVTWVIEVTSQILFSNSASVNYEVLVGRDERSLELGFAAVAGHGHGTPGQIKEPKESDKERKRTRRGGNVQTAGVYSRAVRLVAEDTETLWDKPALPTMDGYADAPRKSISEAPKPSQDESQQEGQQPRKRKKIHLVVLTHGLHSNIGADMLFLKESIDATVKEARLQARERKKKYKDSPKEQSKESSKPNESDATQQNVEHNEGTTATAGLTGGQEDLEDDDESDEEETIVRGFTGNAVKTENGIQYLGKRLAKYILRFTYPDQPFLPVKKSLSRQLTDPFKSDASKAKRDGQASHMHSSIHHEKVVDAEDLPYKFTSISFVGHSLGGLIQTYAVAYIQKHSPGFFQQIKPVNFICMASPMLGLSNENPLYVKFALDFGLVGKTGQDLGLTWRPNTLARGGWNAVIGGLGAGQKEKEKQPDPSAKPLLRILPTGPAHQVLRMFRNRTVYANVVNDGIVPLRTSCLLFLDWRGLGKVDKARRENGLIGTVAEWGWAELTGANAGSIAPNVLAERSNSDEEDDNDHVRQGEGDVVPQPDEDETTEDNRRTTNRMSYDETGGSGDDGAANGAVAKRPPPKSKPQPHPVQEEKGVIDTFFNWFKPSPSPKPQQPSKKTSKALRRAQTIMQGTDELPEEAAAGQEGITSNPTMRPHLSHHASAHAHQKRPVASKGDSYVGENGELQAPPKTSIFESAGDILHPPLPSKQWITDPSSRARTIFHDRVYHPEDIPPPPVKKSRSSRLTRSFSDDALSRSSLHSAGSDASVGSTESGTMKVEEKIARAYHRDLSWRKVLVRLEPDAHNNMIVRRMFANAYGWPVIKHLCDTHFADTYTARTRDEEEPARERAQPMTEPIPEAGEEVKDQTAKKVPKKGAEGSWSSRSSMRLDHQNTAVWDDSIFEGSDGDDSDVDERNWAARLMNPNTPKKPEPAHHRPVSQASSNGPPKSPTTPYTDAHRGLGMVAPASPKAPSTSIKTPAAAFKSTFDSGSVDMPSTPVVADRLVEEPEPLEGTLGSATTVGLGKSVVEQVSAASPKGQK